MICILGDESSETQLHIHIDCSQEAEPSGLKVHCSHLQCSFGTAEVHVKNMICLINDHF